MIFVRTTLLCSLLLASTPSHARPPASAVSLAETAVTTSKKSSDVTTLGAALARELLARTNDRILVDGTVSWAELPQEKMGFDVSVKFALALRSPDGKVLSTADASMTRDDLPSKAQFQMTMGRKSSYAKTRELFASLLAPIIAETLAGAAKWTPHQHSGLISVDGDERLVSMTGITATSALIPAVEKRLLDAGLRSKRVSITAAWAPLKSGDQGKVSVSVTLSSAVSKEVLSMVSQEYSVPKAVLTDDEERKREADGIAAKIVDELLKDIAEGASAAK